MVGMSYLVLGRLPQALRKPVGPAQVSKVQEWANRPIVVVPVSFCLVAVGGEGLPR